MTLRHFRIFQAVCRHASMTAAAKELHISQPSISQAIRELEAHYGTALFDRLGRQLHLTAAGESLRGYATHILALDHQADEAMRGFAAASPIAVGATLSIGESVFVPLLAAFRTAQPECPLFSRIGNTHELEQRLLTDDLDVALIEGDITSPQLIAQPFLRDELIFLAPPNYRLDNSTDQNPLKSAASQPTGAASSELPADTAPPPPLATTIPREAIAGAPFFLREEGSGTRALFEAVMQAAGIPFATAGVYNNSASILQAVAAGLGLAALSRRIAAPYLADGRLRTFTVPSVQFQRTFRIVYHQNKYLTPTLEAFIAFCHSWSQQK